MSKEFVLVKKRSGVVVALRPAQIQFIEEKAEGTLVKYLAGDTLYDILSLQSAAEILALIEGEQERSIHYPVSDEDQKKVIEQYFRERQWQVGARKGEASNDIENVATICPRLRRELVERTGENWSVALMPASIAIAFDSQWQFQCFQGGSRFRYDSKKHLLSFWNNMSGHELEKWIEETIREIIADWRMSAEY